jgi:predicted nucleotidyltransferase
VELAHLESLRRFLHRQEVHAHQQRQEIEERLYKLLPSFARHFPEVEQLWVIGSFTDPRFFAATSDVDIVVRGLPSERYFEALDILERELGVSVDLIREEEAPGSLRVRMAGRELEVLQTLKSEIAALLERTQELDNKIEDYLVQVLPGQALSEPVLITLAYLLNALYSCFEDQFQKIARVFENRITNLASWHRELLERMGIEVEGIRPRVLSRQSLHLLNELRGFRHVFRSSYLFELDEERLRLLLRRWQQGKAQVRQDIQSFLETLSPSQSPS